MNKSQGKCKDCHYLVCTDLKSQRLECWFNPPAVVVLQQDVPGSALTPGGVQHAQVLQDVAAASPPVHPNRFCSKFRLRKVEIGQSVRLKLMDKPNDNGKDMDDGN